MIQCWDFSVTLPSLPHMSTKDDKERELFAQIRKREDAEREDGAPETRKLKAYWYYSVYYIYNRFVHIFVCNYIIFATIT